MLNRILALFLFSSTALADDGKFTLLAEEQPAPFAGVLFDPIATANIMTEKDGWKSLCDIEVEYQLDVAGTEFELERKNFNIRYDALDEEYKCRDAGCHWDQDNSTCTTATCNFFNENDEIPDIIPDFGYLDDATVVHWIVQIIKRDLENISKA